MHGLRGPGVQRAGVPLAMRTVVLAGGFAKRLWPITLNRPKPLLPVAGRPLLDYILDLVPPEFLPVMISGNARFRGAFEEWGRGKPVELVVEEAYSEEEKLGATAALHRLFQLLRDDLLVLAGDNLIRLNLREFRGAAGDEPCVALYDIGDLRKVRGRYGVAVVEGGYIAEFQEKPEEPRSTLVSTACYFLPRDALGRLGEFLAESPRGHDAPGYFLSWLSERLAIRAFLGVEEWLDIGDRASYIEANLRRTGGQSWIHPEARVVDAVIERSVIIGPARIERAHLVECVLDEGTVVCGVDLQRALVGRGSYLRGER